MKTHISKRILKILSEFSINELIDFICNFASSLTGVIVGYVVEYRLIKYIKKLNDNNISNIIKESDHDKSTKNDVSFYYKGVKIGLQVKSPLTNTIKEKSGIYTFKIKNHRSDKTELILSDGNICKCTNYMFGEYDILAVPLFMVNESGEMEYAFIMNYDCPPEPKNGLLMNKEISITYPLTGKWTNNIYEVIENVVNGNCKLKKDEINEGYVKYKNMIDEF